jgi:amino acid transporter
VISGLIFTLEALFFAGAVRFSAFGITSGAWSAFTSYGSPYASEAKVLALPIIVVVSIVVALIATFKDGVIYYGGAARVTQQLAKEDHFLPRVFDRINKHGIPIYAVFLVLIVVVILLALGRSLASIIGVMVDGLLVSYAPGCISLAVFRKTDPDVKRPFKLPAASILAPIGFVVANLLVFWSGWSAVEIIMPLDLAGALLVIVYSRYTKVDYRYMSYGIWLPIYFVAIMIVSFLGSSFFGGINFIPFPYDSIVFIAVTLVFYYIGVNMGIKGSKFLKSKAKMTQTAENA